MGEVVSRTAHWAKVALPRSILRRMEVNVCSACKCRGLGVQAMAKAATLYHLKAVSSAARVLTQLWGCYTTVRPLLALLFFSSLSLCWLSCFFFLFGCPPLGAEMTLATRHATTPTHPTDDTCWSMPTHTVH